MLRKYMYISLGVLIVLLIAVTGITIFYSSPQKNLTVQQENASAEISERVEGENANIGAGMDNQRYYLIMKDHKVNIYKGDEKNFYDYADVNTEDMPVEIREQLKYGLYLDNQEALYDFLQTYSS